MLPSGASNFWRAGAVDMYHHTTSILFLLLKELNQNQRPYSCIFSFLCDGRWFCICLKMFLFLSFRTHQEYFFAWAFRDALPRNWGCTEEEKRHAAITCIRWSGCGGWGLRIKPKDSVCRGDWVEAVLGSYCCLGGREKTPVQEPQINGRKSQEQAGDKLALRSAVPRERGRKTLPSWEQHWTNMLGWTLAWIMSWQMRQKSLWIY